MEFAFYANGVEITFSDLLASGAEKFSYLEVDVERHVDEYA